MNKKLLLTELATLISQRHKITKKKSEQFCRSFFDVIAENLVKEQLVKVKGFGTFKILSVEERESINVHTGERFAIGSHNKISFTPDTILRELVNRPFSQFQTVILNGETEEAELKVAEQRIAQLLRQEEGTTAEKQIPDTPTELQYSDRSEVIPDEQRNVAISNKGEAVPQFSDVPADAENELARHADMHVAETQGTSGEVQPSSQMTDANINSSSVNLQTDQEGVLVPSNSIDTSSRRSIRIWRNFLLLALITSLLMILAYWAGNRHLLGIPFKCMVAHTIPAQIAEEDQEVITPRIPDTKPDAASPDKVGTPSPTPEETQVATSNTVSSSASLNPVTLPAKPTQNVVIDGTLGTYTLRKGDTLWKIAQTYYGSREYANYIIMYNEMKNPDIIPVGSVVKLPLLKIKE